MRRTILWMPLLCVLVLPLAADPAGTPTLLKDIAPGGANSSALLMTPVDDGTVYFRALTSTTGLELWKTDGTTAGTVLVKDIRPGVDSSDLERFRALGSRLLFVADDGTAGLELWTSDGTAAGTLLLKDIQAGSGGSRPGLSEAVLDGALYFNADDGSTGRELWKTDGTAAGTVLVKDLLPGAGSGNPVELVTLGGVVLFRTLSELYNSDGTAAGTGLLKDINPTGNSFPDGLTRVGSHVFFAADDGTTGRELWKTDGTAAGTVLVKDLRAGSASSSPRRLVDVGGTLFFVADDDSGGTELWTSDGTSAGTVRVADIRPGTVGSDPDLLTALDGILYFSADDGTAGRELWRSDGTATGTWLVKDIASGAASSTPGFLTAAGSCVLFRANDGTTGAELWASDGTAAGTALVADLRAGTAGSSPSGGSGVVRQGQSFAVADGTVFFTADTDAYGREPWSVAVVTNTPPSCNPSGAGVYELGSSVTLGGTVADNDGDVVTYEWRDGTTVLDSGTVTTIAGGAPVALPDFTTTFASGVHALELVVDDGQVLDPVVCEVVVEVIDTSAPTLAPVSDCPMLWPPDHRLVTCTIEANAADNDGEPPQLAVTVTSNEPDDGLGDGDTANDIQGLTVDQTTGEIVVDLRAERAGGGTGRVYTVTITATDSAGNESMTSLTIVVPRSRGQGGN